MDRFTILIFVYGLVCYFLGVVFTHKTLSFLTRQLKKLKAIKDLLSEFWNSQKDRLFLLFVVIAPIISFYVLRNSLQKIELIELFVVEGSFFAVIFALIIKDDASRYRNRPIIHVKFKPDFADYYHLTTMHVAQGGVIISAIPTYYIRLKIGNLGKEPMKNVEAILEDVRPRPKNFMPLNLSWAGFNNPPNDVKRNVNISQGQYRTLDIIEAMQPEETAKLATVLNHSGDTDEPRYELCSKGFRSCTIKPNSLSDIYPFGKYILYLRIYADNAEPKLVYIRVDYDGNWDENINIEEMRNKHLRAELLD